MKEKAGAGLEGWAKAFNKNEKLYGLKKPASRLSDFLMKWALAQASLWARPSLRRAPESPWVTPPPKMNFS